MGRLAGLMGGRTSLLFFARSAREQVARGRKGCGPHHDPGKPIVNAVQEERIAAMPGDILCFLGDREEMAHSLEARLPYLDHLLYEQARSIPVDFKFRKGVEKAVLRDAAKDILPDDLRLRRKSGFMLTSEAVDFYGADRGARERLERYFDKRTFENAGVFSYRAFRLARLLAKLPRSRTFGLLQLRRNANKALMYMLQAHMLHDMFVERPRWIAATEAHPGKSMAA
jgi:hypothetical protein